MEPIAIVGMACRLPGAPDVDAYWRLLRNGVDAIREVPPDRWDLAEFYDPDGSRPGKMTTRWGGFLDRVDAFDPSFFGISPREAGYMDPQQRLLLEVAFEALEDAGLVLDQWAGRAAGVFVGISTYDYGVLQLAAADRIADGYANTGSALSIAANRLSYLFDFRGPSVAVDTACSSSLAATHLACQSLWSGESTLALAGGVNVILAPAITIGFSKLNAMAADGRCKSFDARADGYVRGEGAGLVVLKPLAHALRDGDRIHAVIRGSAMNQDGRTNGLTAPNGLSQEALIRQALERAGVEPRQISYVEAHGTGTPLGDPIELNALGAVLASGRPAGSRCAVGSVKSNIGHLEAAAGIAGLIKVTLALEHREIPPSLHFEQPNPHIPFDKLPLEVQRKLANWPEEARPARAGVSSFGFGGTNVHLVLEEPPAAPHVRREPDAVERPYVVPFSARSQEALQSLARAWGGALPDAAALPDLAYTMSRRRSHHDHRLAVVARSTTELAEHLQAFLAGEPRPGLSAGRAGRGRRRKLVFVFPGQGSQWFGMARGLLAREPDFRAALDRCADAIREEVGWSLLDELQAYSAQSGLATVDRIQPALWAIQVGLAALWRSWGVEPDAVVGHSLGEVAAAHVAGAVSLEDAARVICRRSRLLRRTSGRGAMAAVELSIEQAVQALAGYEDRVSIAVSNSPSSTVLSGDVAALEEILAALESRNVFCRRVKVDVASHSPQMDPLRSELLQELEGMKSKPPAVPLLSTVTGEVSGALPLDGTYWVRNLREPVLFSRAVQRLVADKHSLFVELSPHPILLAAVQQTLQHLGKEGVVLPSLRREEDEQAVMLGSLGALHTAGRAVDWAAVSPAGRVVRVPSYPWQRERFWLERESSVPSVVRRRAGHPLLGEHLQSAARGTHFWDMDLGAESLPYLADHRVQGAIVLPAAAFLEMALAAARQAFGPGAYALEEVQYKRALLLPEQGALRVQIVLSPAISGLSSFQVFALPAGREANAPAAVLHATGAVRLAAAQAMTAAPSLPAVIQARCVEVVSSVDHYRDTREQGLEYGPRFQGIEQIWRRDGEALARLRLPEDLAAEVGAHEVHPALLDACFQVLPAALPRQIDAPRGAYLPVALARLSLDDAVPAAGGVWGHAVLHEDSRERDRGFAADVFLLDEGGRVAVAAHGLRVQPLERTQDGLARRSPDDWLYEVRWEIAPRPEPAGGTASSPGTWLVLADRQGVGEALRAWLEASGDRCILVSREDAHDGAGYYRQLLAAAVDGGQPSLRGVVHLWSLDTPASAATSAVSLGAFVELTCLSALHLTQALAAAAGREKPRLWLVTGGAQPAGPAGDGVSIAQAPLWGLGRTIAHEHPELRCTNVDLGPSRPPEEERALSEELRSDGPEREVALRGDQRFVARLARFDVAQTTPPANMATREQPRAEVDLEQNLTLTMAAPGILDNLAVRPAPRTRPGPGQVEIRVHASGLNFLDVLGAMGLRPDAADGPLQLGAECAGEITAVGEGVADLAVGDAVVAVAPASFSAFVTTPASLVARKPASLTDEEAATIPIAFLTADYALRHLGRLRKGERVLIHAAAGGVGLAAVQLAQRRGAEIFATAGTGEKRDLVRSLGVRHVMDSRSLEFAEEIRRLTAGQGVDVVLNSLAGEAIPASLSVLGAYGRFLEIGKRDIYEDRALGLRPFQNNLSFFAVDLNRMVRERPRLVGSLLRGLMRSFARGRLSPLPRRVFPVSDAVNAFHHMAQAKHVGKVVLDMQDVEARLALVRRPGALRADGTYLITGGLGGLGLAVARWMVGEGARHLVLLGRSGASAEAEPLLEEMRQAGARVVVIRADVSEALQVTAAFSEIERTLPRMRGVIHAAGRLDDGILSDLDRGRLRSVMKPKTEGAWNLHVLTLGQPLDFFVLFSSAASILGSPGQGNYAAANSFLDALAHQRRSLGLPGLAINWGPWSDVGLAARPDRGGRLAAGGIESLSPAQGVATLGRLLGTGAAQVCVMPVDWPAWRRRSVAIEQMPLLAAFVGGDGGSPHSALSAMSSTTAMVLAAAPAQRQQILEKHLQEQVARVLRFSASKLDVSRPLSTMGIDSLMAVELKNRIEADLQVSLPLIQVIQGPSVSELAEVLLAQMGRGGVAVAPCPAPMAPAPRGKESLLLSLLALGKEKDARDE